MKSSIRFALMSLACGSFVLLAGCNPNKPVAQQQGASVAQLVGEPAAETPASDANKPVDTAKPASSYAPPTAAQLISLLAPVAVFPDKLVAQVLAASSYPDQITQANNWLAQNPQLKGDALQQAIDKQDWDPSVKAVAVFPEVLHQMANNIPWTTALGDAYVNDPNDVMNAIQALRAQALACNNLKSDKYLTVTKTARNVEPSTVQYEDEPAVYSGPPVIPPPDEIIEIEPAQPDYVYVPYYDPYSYYGTPIAFWPGYYYAWPAPVYYGPVFAFGFGFWIGGHHHHDWGWNRWDVNWGNGFDRHWGGRAWRDSAVVYNNQPYVSRSTTVINRFADPASRAASTRASFVPATRNLATTTAAPATATSAGFAGRTPTDFSRITAPQFTSAMAQRSAVTATSARASFAQSSATLTNARPGALASSSYYTSRIVSRPAQSFDRAGALPSSSYAPAAQRSGFSGAARTSSFAARENARMSSPGYAPSRQAFTDGGYRVQSVQRSYASAPSMARSYAAPPRSYGPAPAMRGPAPMASRSFASAPRMQSAPHYSAPRSAPSGGGGRGGRDSSRH